MVVCHFATFENTRIKCTHPFWKTGTGFGYHFGGWGKPPVDEVPLFLLMKLKVFLLHD
ncbi:hypothetical protein COLO4_24290 [Corchorus olitorius]|uniref:Uncharacterized protein n=1 Tax=Corchorus olitorius TaxID=93759 RepID=A0A1R3IBF0_9ROSI|nr:hypothetical protein COLO4_24290 [Corchorus olitorius]